jgi:hypothetical protein
MNTKKVLLVLSPLLAVAVVLGGCDARSEPPKDAYRQGIAVVRFVSGRSVPKKEFDAFVANTRGMVSTDPVTGLRTEWGAECVATANALAARLPKSISLRCKGVSNSSPEKYFLPEEIFPSERSFRVALGGYLARVNGTTPKR